MRLSLLVLAMLACQACALYTPEASTFCGCVEHRDFRSVPVRNWTMLERDSEGSKANSARKVVADCNNFCDGAAHFTVRALPDDQFLCRCYAEELRYFDCAEVEGVPLVRIHCKEVEVTEEEIQDFEDFVEEIEHDIENHVETPYKNETGSSTTPRAMTYTRSMLAIIKNGFRQTNRTGHALHFFNSNGHEDDSNDKFHISSDEAPSDKNQALKVTETKSEPKSFKEEDKKEAFGLAALVLGLLCVLCLTAFVIKTWCEHKKRNKKLREEREGSVESGSTHTSGLSSAANSHVSITSIVPSGSHTKLGTPPPRPPPPRARLDSLGDIYVYEKF